MTPEQIALTESIIAEVAEDQSRRAEVNDARADALRSVLSAALHSSPVGAEPPSLVALVDALKAHAKEHGWQDVDEPIAALLAWTPAVGAESPALSDQFDGWIVYVPNRSFTSVYGLFVGYDEAIAWRCRNGYDADNSHVYPIRRVEADNAAPQPAAVPTDLEK